MKRMQRKIRIGILVLVGCLLFSSCTVTGPPKTETTKSGKDTGSIATETAEFHKVKEPTVMESTESGKIPEQPITQVPESGYKGYEWLYGDLHMHTLYSDGRHLYWDVIEYCIQAGFNYVATTDHNTTRQNYEEYREEYGDLIIIPGVEDTVTDKGNPFYSGHFNVLGLKEPPVGIYNYNSKAYPENYNIFEDGDEIFKQVSEITRKVGGKLQSTIHSVQKTHGKGLLIKTIMIT